MQPHRRDVDHLWLQLLVGEVATRRRSVQTARHPRGQRQRHGRSHIDPRVHGQAGGNHGRLLLLLVQTIRPEGSKSCVSNLCGAEKRRSLIGLLHERPRSTIRLSRTVRSDTTGAQWSGPMKLRVVCELMSGRMTESDRGSGPSHCMCSAVFVLRVHIALVMF